MARLAKVEDIDSIMSFAADRFAASSFSEDCRYNPLMFRATLRAAIMTPSSCAIIDHRDGQVCALLVGTCDPLPWSAAKVATDIVFVATAHGNRCIGVFEQWAKIKGAVRMYLSVSEPDDSGRIGRLFMAKGLQPTGGVYLKRFNAPAAQKAG